jgi:hypothetical protein
LKSIKDDTKKVAMKNYKLLFSMLACSAVVMFNLAASADAD